MSGPTRRISWDACDHETAGEVCGATGTVRRYLIGLRCPRHTPAAMAGRSETTPDPSRTAEAMRDGPARIAPDPSRYGTATTDPLGRTVEVDGGGKRLSIPKRPCPLCDDRGRKSRAVGHNGPHDHPATKETR